MIPLDEEEEQSAWESMRRPPPTPPAPVKPVSTPGATAPVTPAVPPPAVNELTEQYREILREREAGPTTRTRAAVIQAHGTPPDRAARIKEIEQQTGLPYVVIDRNFDALDKRATVEAVPYHQIQTQTPKLAEWVAAAPGNVAVASDDMEQLGFLEWVLTATPRLIVQKLWENQAGRLRAKRAFYGGLTREEEEALLDADLAKKVRGRMGVPADAWWFTPRKLSAGLIQTVTQYADSLVRSVPQAMAMGGAGATLGAAGGFATAGLPGAVVGATATAVSGFGLGLTTGLMSDAFAVEYGGAQEEFTDPAWRDEFGQPMDPDVAEAAAITAGALNAGLELFQLKTLVNSFPALKNLKGRLARDAVKTVFARPSTRRAIATMVKEYPKTLSKEVATEVAQRAVTMTAGELAKWYEDNGARMRTGDEWLDELGQEATGALSAFALMSGVGPTTGLARDLRRAQRATAAEAFFTAIDQGVTDSETVKRSPAAAQEFFQRVTKDGPVQTVYIEAEPFSEYWQSKGFTPEQVTKVAAELTGNPQALAQAQATGEALAIPTASYATKIAGTEHHAGLAGDLKIGPLGPDEMTGKQAKAFREALLASQQAAAEAAQAEPTGARPVHQTLSSMFQRIGMSAARAEVNAALLEAGFAGAARRAGLPLEAVFRRFGLRMERPGYAPATQQQEPESGAAPQPGASPAAPAAPPGGAAPSGEPGAPPAATVPDSVLSAFPDMPEGEGGLLPLARFSGEEQAALEAAGLVTEATTSDGTTYRGVDPAKLWPLRQARAAEGTTREPQLTPEGEASLARRRAAAGVESPGAAAAAAEPAAEPTPTAEADRGDELPGPAAEPVADAERGVQPGAGPAAHPSQSAFDRLPPSTRGVFAGLFSDAVARGFTGTDTSLADQFLEQFERARVIAADLEAISHDNSWRQILVEISKFGGINPAKEGKGGFQGEVEWLMESLRWGSGVIRRGRRAGQIMPVQSAGLRGGGGLVAAPGIVVRKGGHSLDTVREHLQQDPRWKHLDNLTDFLVILEDAVLKGNQENKGEVVSVGSAPSVWSTLEGLLEVREGSTWWKQPDELEGDVSFDVDEFFQRLFGMPLFELADEIAEAEAAAQPPPVTPPPPAPVVAPPDVIVLPPEGALLTREVYNASLRTTYFDEEGVARARTSRVESQTAPIPPLGTWMVDDSFAAMDGHELEQLVEVPIDALEISEDTGADRFGDVARYARWLLEGKEPPPIRVVQTDKGTLKTLDHRRLLAAKAIGARTIKAWVSWATISPRQGNPVVGLTRELATQGAGPLTVAPADPDRTIFVDDARRLETLRAELAAAGVPTATAAPTPAPATDDVLDTGEVQPRLPGAQAVREQEQATPTLEAPFALTSEVARRTGTQETLFQRDPRFDPAIRLYLERGANRSPVRMAQALRDAGYRFGRMATPAEKRAGLDLLQQLIAEAEGPADIELFQAAPGDPSPVTPPSFYSRLIRAVEASPQARASGAQWKATIKNAKIGINLEEYALVSVDDLVDGQTYTQADVLEYLRLNEVKVEEVTLGTPITEPEILDLASRLQSDRMDEARDRTEPPDFDINIGDVSIEYDEEADEYTVHIDGQEVGTFPDESSAEEAVREQEDSIRQGLEEEWWNDWEREQQQAYDDDDAYKDAKEILMDQRPANERGAMFEEYVVPGGIDGSYREAFLTAQAPPVPWADGHDDYWMIENPIVRVRYDFRHDADGNYLLFVHEIQPPQPENQKRMPPLFLKHWRELGIKYTLKVAVENGAQAVAWTSGQHQIDLYPSIESEVKRITMGFLDDTRVLGIEPINQRRQAAFRVVVDSRGVITRGLSDNTERWVNAPLESVVGKEIAERIMGSPEPFVLEGEGLKVGGRGLRKLYDVDLVNVANKIIKKSGAKVGATPLLGKMSENPKLREARDAFDAATNALTQYLMVEQAFTPVAAMDFAVVLRQNEIRQAELAGAHGRQIDLMQAAFDARQALEKANRLPPVRLAREVPSVPITAELRSQVLGGQAYFQHPHDEDALTDELAQPQRPTGAKGSVRFDPTQRGAAQRTLTLSLFEGHDASTVIHEASHIFLEVMQDLAAEAPALAADLAVLKAWAADPQNSGPLLSEYQHEQIARAFETYVMEGRAPSVELRGVFAKMRSWMLDVYRAAKGLVPGLDRKINNDVRAVFDRLLASDQAIAEAKQAGQVVPIFLTPETAGMSATEFELYRRTVEAASTKAREDLDKELLAEVRREDADAYKARREEVRAAVEREVNATPVYQALAAMQKGETPDGQPLTQPAEDNKPQRLSRAIVSARFGQALVTQLPRTILTKQDGGLDPDVIAEVYGFTSADHLLQAIVNSPPRKELIEEETNARMAALFPSLLDDEAALTAAAQAALSDESRDRVVRAELRALNKLKRTAQPFQRAAAGAQRTESRDAERERAYERRWFEAEARLRVAMAEGRKQTEIDALKDDVSRLRQQARSGAVTVREGIPDTDAFRQAAETRIAGMRVSELTPQVFWSAATKASRKATEAAARQDFDGAIAAKHQELLNLALYREARRAQVDVDKRVRRVREIARPASRARLGKAGATYLEQIDKILERFEFKPVSRKDLRRRANISNWIAAMEGEGRPVDLPEILLNEAFRTHYSELTVEDFVAVTDGLAHILHLARTKNRLLKHRQQRDLAELSVTLVASIEDHVKKKVPPPRGDRRPSEQGGRTVSGFFASHRKLASLLRELDGWQDGGPMWEAVMRPLNAAGDREVEMQAHAAAQLHGLIDQAFPRRAKSRLYHDRLVPEIGTSLSQMERLMVALNWGNEGNRDRVRGGNKWTDAQVQAILDTLTTSELHFVQGMFDYLNTYWPEIAAKAQRVNGLPPAKVEAVEIVTANGRIPGGYFPLKSRRPQERRRDHEDGP